MEMKSINVEELLNEIIDLIMKSRNEEFTTAMLCKNILGEHFISNESNKLMDIHYKLMDELEKRNLKMEYTDDGIIGLPYNISFIVKEK